MGGKGSGGARTGAGRKPKSELERAVGGNAGRRSATVLVHPSSPTGVAPVEQFEPEAAWFLPPGMPLEPVPDEPPAFQTFRAEASAAQKVWCELAPHAFAARTLTRATASAFAMLCRAVATERGLLAPDADRRGLMQRIAAWKKDFSLAPLGKPMFSAQPEAPPARKLDRFTKKTRRG